MENFTNLKQRGHFFSGEDKPTAVKTLNSLNNNNNNNNTTPLVLKQV
jgi:hypothetical protein